MLIKVSNNFFFAFEFSLFFDKIVDLGIFSHNIVLKFSNLLLLLLRYNFNDVFFVLLKYFLDFSEVIFDDVSHA